MVYQCRRDTLAFDQILYRDRFIEVTPSLLVIDGYYLPFVGPKVIAVEEIERVWRGLDSDLKLKWWERVSGGEAFAKLRNALGISRDFRPRRNNLVIAVRGDKLFRVGVAAAKPNDAYNAIKHAMGNFY